MGECGQINETNALSLQDGMMVASYDFHHDFLDAAILHVFLRLGRFDQTFFEDCLSELHDGVFGNAVDRSRNC